MKTFKKIKLDDFPILDDQEMKKIVGSYNGGTPSNNCPNGISEKECAFMCTFESSYEGQTILGTGHCHYSGYKNLCMCIADTGFA